MENKHVKFLTATYPFSSPCSGSYSELCLFNSFDGHSAQSLLDVVCGDEDLKCFHSERDQYKNEQYNLLL